MSQQSIRRSIEATEKIRKITKAMQLVSVNHLTRASALERNGRPYVAALKDIMQHWMHKHVEHTHVYFQSRPVVSQLIITYGSDRGLCGAMNLNVLKMTMEKIISDRDNLNIDSHVITVGEKALQFLGRHGVCIEASVSRLGMHPHIEQLTGIIKILIDGYLAQKWQRVVLIYPKFINTMTQVPVTELLLPLEPIQSDQKSLSDHVDYLYEPNVATVIDRLLENYIDALVYQATLETLASEQAARMVAMQSATDNAETCKHELERSYHKIRQAGITREIAEITAGAEAI